MLKYRVVIKCFFFLKFICQTCCALLMAPSTYSQLLGDRKQWRTRLIRDGLLEFVSCSSKFFKKKSQKISMRLKVNLLPCSAPTGTTKCGTSPTCWSTLTGRFSGFRRRFIRFCSSIRRLNSISYLPEKKKRANVYFYITLLFRYAIKRQKQT